MLSGNGRLLSGTQAAAGTDPQPSTQKEGIGFPLARIAAVFSLACGAVLDLGICRFAGKGQSELGLLRLLWALFEPGDVMLADRYVCSWFEIAILKQRGADSVCRLHQQRMADFRRGKRLGKEDHIVQYHSARLSHRRRCRGDDVAGCGGNQQTRSRGTVSRSLERRTGSAFAETDPA